jgi:hypothetical protein
MQALIVRRSINVLGLVFALGWSVVVLAAPASLREPSSKPEVEVVWIGMERLENRGEAGAPPGNTRSQHQLLYQKYVNDGWDNAPQTIYVSPHSLATPSLASKRSGEKILVWSEQIAGEAQLKIMRGRVSRSDRYAINWQGADLFSDLGRYNIAPSVVIDAEDRAWVFWAADVDAYSDIYYSRETAQGWTEAKRVHSRNQVPDILPFATLTDNVGVQLEWLSYDLDSRRYKLASKLYLGKNKPHKQASAQRVVIEQTRSEEFAYPDFLPGNQRIVLHFPNHRYIQSRKPDAVPAAGLVE